MKELHLEFEVVAWHPESIPSTSQENLYETKAFETRNFILAYCTCSQQKVEDSMLFHTRNEIYNTCWTKGNGEDNFMPKNNLKRHPGWRTKIIFFPKLNWKSSRKRLSEKTSTNWLHKLLLCENKDIRTKKQNIGLLCVFHSSCGTISFSSTISLFRFRFQSADMKFKSLKLDGVKPFSAKSWPEKCFLVTKAVCRSK